MVEQSTNRTLKTLRSDNGGEYLLCDFQEYLRCEGIRHEQAVHDTPESNPG